MSTGTDFEPITDPIKRTKIIKEAKKAAAEIVVDDEIKKLDKEYPLIPHTNAVRLYSTVRRMKAEKERNIPIDRRTGFAVSVKTGKAANKMTRREWESFYRTLSKRLKTDYPDSYAALFPEGRR